MIDGLHTTWCQVSNMDRSVAFYRDLLGLKAGYISPYWSSFDLGNGQIGLHPMLEDSTEPLGIPNKGWMLGLKTPDIRHLRNTLEHAGANIIGDYHAVPGGVVLTVADPDGNAMQIIEMGATLEQIQKETAETR